MQQLDWTATLSSMKDSLPRAQFLSWIEPIEFLQSDETSIRLGVPSRFHEEILKAQWTQQLVQAIQKQVGRTYQLEFEVLLQKENTQAAFSLSPPPNTQNETPAGRPSLRVIDGDLSENPAHLDSIPDAREVFRPNLPRFSTPYFPHAFNYVAHKAVEVFADDSEPLHALFIVAGVGMGKTHLLSEIGSLVHARSPFARIRYTSSEAFTTEMVQSFKNPKENAHHLFKTKYREETDLLLFDDIHQLSGREKTQEQVLHIFNDLLAAGKKIAFTSNVLPSQLKNFSDGLKSRLQSLMSVEISSPNAEERVKLLANVCEHNRMPVSGEALLSLSDSQGSSDIRELVGTLVGMHLRARLEKVTLDADYLAKNGVGFARTLEKPRATLEEVVRLIELNFSISRVDLCGPSRKNRISWPRQVAMYLARRVTLMPLEGIGEFFTRDHATVLHAYNKVADAMKSQRSVQLEIEYLVGRLEKDRT